MVSSSQEHHEEELEVGIKCIEISILNQRWEYPRTHLFNALSQLIRDFRTNLLSQFLSSSIITNFKDIAICITSILLYTFSPSHSSSSPSSPSSPSSSSSPSPSGTEPASTPWSHCPSSTPTIIITSGQDPNCLFNCFLPAQSRAGRLARFSLRKSEDIGPGTPRPWPAGAAAEALSATNGSEEEGKGLPLPRPCPIPLGGCGAAADLSSFASLLGVIPKMGELSEPNPPPPRPRPHPPPPEEVENAEEMKDWRAEIAQQRGSFPQLCLMSKS
nr:hypothetical protein Iba_chr15aCG6310 [Ipomoea batatas]